MASDYDPFIHHLRMMSGPTKVTKERNMGSGTSDWGKMVAEATRESDRAVVKAQMALHDLQVSVENAINATPTSARRNLLTEINMNLMLQAELLIQAANTRVQEG